MGIKFAHTVVCVENLEVSKEFYSKVIGIEIKKDYGFFVLFENEFSIHQAKELDEVIFGQKDEDFRMGKEGQKNILIYFETDNLEEKYQDIRELVEIIHPIKETPWGQKVFRFYDPDRHLVELGEPLFLKF